MRRSAVLLLLGLFMTVAVAVASVYLLPAKSLAATRQVSRWAAGLQPSEVEIDGLRIAYLDGGAGEPLVLLHGFGGDKDSFVRVARQLTESHRVILPDLPGFGESDKPLAIDYDVDAQVDRLHAFTRYLGLTRFVLGGNSMGGFIAAAYGARHPDEVSALWLLAPGGIASAPPSELAVRLQAQGRSLVADSQDDFEHLLAYAFARPPRLPTPWLRVLASRALEHRDVHEKVFAQTLASTPLEQRVLGLAVPTLIVWGERDRIIHPAAAGILHGLLPNSRIVSMPDVGHAPMIEDPAQTARDFIGFWHLPTAARGVGQHKRAARPAHRPG